MTGHLNVEIKAHCERGQEIHNLLLEKGSRFVGTDHQVDTYFHVPNGRLKLREGTIERHLIHYLRPDRQGPKTSEVMLYDPGPDETLKLLLQRALGVLVVVDKRRRIHFIDNVKFHIDSVEGLGTFVEIEAIDREGSLGEEALRKQCEEYLELLGIESSDLVENSYSDMLLEAQ